VRGKKAKTPPTKTCDILKVEVTVKDFYMFVNVVVFVIVFGAVFIIIIVVVAAVLIFTIYAACLFVRLLYLII
jgi:hypothetical protein